MQLQEIKSKVLAYPKIKSDDLQSLINQCAELKEIQKKYRLIPKGIKWHIIHDIPFCEHVCKICGKPVEFYNSQRGYNLYCSKTCRSLDSEYFEKLKENNLKKYGCESYFQTKEFKEKSKQTCLKKYGVENAACSTIIKERTKQTCLKKYGYTSTALVPEIKTKQKETLFKNYGVTEVMHSPVIAKKIAKNKIHLGYTSLLQRAKHARIKPLFTLEEYQGGFYDKIYKWECLDCGEIFEQYYNNGIVPICRKCHPKQFGLLQKQVAEYIKTIYSGEIILNSRSIIPPKELDIYIPELKLAIEFNGDYWHNADRLDKNYHLNKTIACEEKGIKLIHIWEHDWLGKEARVKQRLNYLINNSSLTKVFARNCTVKLVNNCIANTFLDNYHLQGSINSKVNLGLYHNDELVALMTFGKPRFNKNYQWELLRFVNKAGYSIPGGAGKLLKYFEREYKPNSLISYADRCWSAGNLYKQLGFNLLEASKSNYIWFKKGCIYTRYQTQKHKLKDLLGKDNFDPNKSETDNMEINGFLKVYDYGNLVFVKEYLT